jgi:hypothetical protein
MNDWSDLPTMTCRVCDTDVPAGAFCGLCGADLTPQHGDGPDWLRLRTFAAAPGERVLRPAVASSLFPQLPQTSRTPFRLGLAALALTLAVFALLRWQAPMIAVAALGLPVSFLIYLYETGGWQDLPARMLTIGTVLGVTLGVGWALLTGPVAARSYGFALGTGMTGQNVLLVGLAIPLGVALLMVVPVIVGRMLRPAIRESLDGFLIGALGAACFTAAATLTRLAPQFTTGTVSQDRPVIGLIVQAGVHGVALPVIATAVGGVVGVALWFQRRPDTSRRDRWAGPGILVAGLLTPLVGYAALGLTDVARIPQGVRLGLYLLITALVLLALRVVLQTALLHERHDEPPPNEPLLCPQCNHVVPDMAFCPSCGAATQASSRSSRAGRRLTRPVPTDGPTEGS